MPRSTKTNGAAGGGPGTPPEPSGGKLVLIRASDLPPACRGRYFRRTAAQSTP